MSVIHLRSRGNTDIHNQAPWWALVSSSIVILGAGSLTGYDLQNPKKIMQCYK